MAPTTPFYNLMYLGLLIFGVAFFFLGLFGKSGAISVLRGENKTTTVLMGLGGVLVAAAFVVWGASDLLQGPSNSTIVGFVRSIVSSVINTSLAPWQAAPGN